jgi:hypothetical protein
MADIDGCEKQLALARSSIKRNDRLIAAQNAETAQKKKDYDDALDNYNDKETIYNQAVTTFNNYKTDQSHKETLPGSNSGCHTNWTDEACQRNCTSDKNGKFSGFGGAPGGANIGYEWDNCYQDCCVYKNNRVCVCKMPNPDTYAANGRAIETAKTIMDQAKTAMESKKTIYETALGRGLPPINLKVACCRNTVSCVAGADCTKITQKCQATINDLKKNIDRAALDNNPSSVGENDSVSIDYIESTDTNADNTPIIGSGLLSCCCFCIIIIVVIFMIKKSKNNTKF